MFIKIKTFPNSKKEKAVRKKDDEYQIYVKEKAEQGKANEAVKTKVGKEFNINSSHIRIVKGRNSPNKILDIPDK